MRDGVDEGIDHVEDRDINDDAPGPALADAGRQFDVVFLDPPYESDLYEPFIELSGERLLAAGGVVVAEHFHKRSLPERIGALIRTRQKRVGDHCLSFYSRGGEGDTE